MFSFKSAMSETAKTLNRITNQNFPSILPMDLTKYFDEESERHWTEPFSFIVTADTQFGLIEKHILKKPDPRWDEELALTRSTIRCINRMRPKPKFMVVCGDMLDEQPANEEKIALRNEQYQDFVQVFQELDPEIPLVCVCGNHDICDVPTEKSYDVYREQFGPDFYCFWVGGVKFVVVNSQYLKQPEALPSMTEKQEEFIGRIGDSRAKHIVVFQHIPFFVKEAMEDDVSFVNIDQHMRVKIMDMYDAAGVSWVFCGHYHRNAGGRYKGFEQVVTTALGGTFGVDPSGYRLCQVTSEGIFHQYIPVMMDANARVPRAVPNADINKVILRANFMNHLKTIDTSSNQAESPTSEEQTGNDKSHSSSPTAVQPTEASRSFFNLRDFLSMKLFH